jgi:hypothetical protein
VTVAQVGAGVAAFVQGGADRVGELGFDQRLVDRLGGLTDAVTDIGDLKCVQDFEQGRLIQGHRVVPLYRFLGGFLQRLCECRCGAPGWRTTRLGAVILAWLVRDSAAAACLPRDLSVEVAGTGLAHQLA